MALGGWLLSPSPPSEREPNPEDGQRCPGQPRWAQTLLRSRHRHPQPHTLPSPSRGRQVPPKAMRTRE